MHLSGRLRSLTDPDRLRVGALVVVLAAAAGAWAVVGSQRVFPYLSVNNDEPVYLLQADALRHGRLFAPAPDPADAFVPWLSRESDGRFVFKYAPVHASVLALGAMLPGSERAALALIAAGVVVLSYLLAHELLRDRIQAAIATLFLALSPLFLIQSATFLSYCSGLLLLEGFALALLRGLRLRRPAFLIASGLFLGLAMFARPFDALLFAAPFAGYLVVAGGKLRDLVRNGSWIAAGAVGPLLAMLMFNEAATGNVLRSPFFFVEPLDQLGFGLRKLYPEATAQPFGLQEGLIALARHAGLTAVWVFGGPLLIGLAAAALLRRRSLQLWFALVALTIPLGYVFFWGSYNAAVIWGGISYVGPFYYLPVLVPLAVLAAKGLGHLWRWKRPAAGFALAVMLAFSGTVAARTIQRNLVLTEQDRKLYAPLLGSRLVDALVFVPQFSAPYLLHPLALTRNDVAYDGNVVYALNAGNRNLAVLETFPGRKPYVFRIEGHYRKGNYRQWHRNRFQSSLEPAHLVRGRSLQLRLRANNPTSSPRVVLDISVNGRNDSFVLDTTSWRGKRYEATLRVGVEATHLDGRTGATSTAIPVEPSEPIRVSLLVGGQGSAVRAVYDHAFPYRVLGEQLEVLLPGSVSRNETGSSHPLLTAG